MKRHNSGSRAFGLLALFAGLAVAVHAQAPFTLTDAMRAALSGSEEAQLMKEKETKLYAQKDEALSGAMPNVQLYADAGRGAEPFYIGSLPTAAFGGGSDSSSNGGNGAAAKSTQDVYSVTEDRFDYGIQVTQPIYSFGRVGQAYHVAGTLLRSQAESNHYARQQLELQTLDVFYNFVTAIARLHVIESSLKRQTETVGFLQSNFQMGSGQRSSVLLATSSLKALEPQRIHAQSDVEAARMALNRITGRPVQAALDADTSESEAQFEIPAVDTSEAGIQNILDRRPDLTSMRLQKEALKGEADAYRMLYRPSLGLQGKLGMLAFKPNNELTDINNDLEWQVGVGFQWNIFDGFAQSSKAKEFDSDARSMALSEREAWAMARIEVSTALSNADAADTGYEAAVEARDAADEARQMLAEDFHSGKGQITDLLSAEEGLRNAELGVLNAGYQRVRAKAALRVALGMDLIEEGSK